MEKLLRDADDVATLVEADGSEASADLAGHTATYRRAREDDTSSDVKLAGLARCVLSFAVTEGIAPDEADDAPKAGTKDALRAEVDALALDVPANATKAQLQAALDEHHGRTPEE